MKKIPLWLMILSIGMFGSTHIIYSMSLADNSDTYNTEIHDPIQTLLSIGAIYGDDPMNNLSSYKDRIFINGEDAKVVRDEARKWMQEAVYRTILSGIKKLNKNGKISVEEYVTLRDSFNKSIFVDKSDPDKIYMYFLDLEKKENDSSNSDTYNTEIHDPIQTLLSIGAIYGDEAIGKTSYYKDRIYRNYEDVKVVRDDARKWMQDSVYANIKVRLAKLLDKGYISQIEYSSILERYYSNIFNYNNLVETYKNYVSLEKQELNQTIKNDNDALYGKIKYGLNKLLTHGLITQAEYEITLDTYYKDVYQNIFTNPEATYNNYLTFEKKKLNQKNTTSQIEIQAPTTARVGEAIDIILRAVDKDNNTVSSYRGSVVFNTDDIGDTIPAPGKSVSFTSDDNGVRKFSKGVVFKKSGKQRIMVYDVSDKIQGEVTITVLENEIQFISTTPDNIYYNQIKTQLGTKLAQLSLEKLESSLKRTKLIERRYKEGTKNKLRLQAMITLILEEIKLRMEDEVDVDSLLN